MPNVKDLLRKIESGDISYEEKLAALSQVEASLQELKAKKEERVKFNVQLIIDEIKKVKQDVQVQLDYARSIVPERGPKGDQGERGVDGAPGRNGVDGRDGRDGKDGQDGQDGVSVTGAKIDFDGSLIITLSTGREINVGEVVAADLAEKIRVTMSTNSTVAIQDEGSTITSGVRNINFTGSGVTATASGDSVTVNVSGGGGGGVTSVTGTAPVVSSGGTTPAISLAADYGDTQNPYASKTANFFLAAPNGSSGAPAFRAIVAADIPTLNQNTTGTAAGLSATLAISSGGTGQTTRQDAMDALAGAVTSGQYLRGNGTDVVMSAIQAADVPTLNQNTTGNAATATTATNVSNGLVSSSRINPRVSSTTSTASITPDISSFDQYAVTAQAATLTINAPTGTPVDGNKLIFRILDNGTSQNLSWNATYTVIGVTLPTTTTINKMTYVGCIYNAANTRWDVIAVTTQA
jgi:hypothetical protein